MVHRNARLTLAGRKILVDRIAAGSPPAHVAAQMGCPGRPRTSVGEAGAKKERPVLEDRLSQPRRSRLAPGQDRGPDLSDPHDSQVGTERIAAQTGVRSSTLWALLARYGLNRLSWLDRPTGRVIRCYERDHPWWVDPPRHQEDRPCPTRRRLASSWPRPDQASPSGRLHLPPRRHR